MPNAFVDSNILIYAADDAKPSARKTRIARELLRQRGLHMSVQVLNEFTVNARHKAKLNLSPERELEWLRAWLHFPVVPLSVDTFLAARLIHARYQLSHWDSLIVASSHETNCSILYSEDLNHGQDFDGLKVIDPFLAT